MVLVSTISPLQAHRDFARQCIGGDFMEVYVKADIETCRSRDPKKLYEKLDTDASPISPASIPAMKFPPDRIWCWTPLRTAKRNAPTHWWTPF